MDVRDFAGSAAINIFERSLAGPKVIAIEENAQVLMRGLAHDARKRVEREDKRGGTHEFHHGLQLELLRSFRDFAKICSSGFVIVQSVLGRIGGSAGGCVSAVQT